MKVSGAESLWETFSNTPLVTFLNIFFRVFLSIPQVYRTCFERKTLKENFFGNFMLVLQKPDIGFAKNSKYDLVRWDRIFIKHLVLCV